MSNGCSGNGFTELVTQNAKASYTRVAFLLVFRPPSLVSSSVVLPRDPDRDILKRRDDLFICRSMNLMRSWFGDMFMGGMTKGAYSEPTSFLVLIGDWWFLKNLFLSIELSCGDAKRAELPARFKVGRVTELFFAVRLPRLLSMTSGSLTFVNGT